MDIFKRISKRFHIISTRNRESGYSLLGFYRYSFLGLFWRRHNLTELDLRRLHRWLRDATDTVLFYPPAADDTGNITTVRGGIIDFLNVWRPKIKGIVLDVGVGTWTYCRELLSNQCEYTATDCFEHSNIDIVSDIHDLTSVFEPNSYDFIICTDVIEHVANPQAAVRGLYTVLKPGGILLLTTPFNYPIHVYSATDTSVVNDYWRFTEAGLRLLLGDFSELNVAHFGKASFPDSYHVVAWK